MRKAALQDCNARSAEVLCEVSNTNCLLLRTTVMVYCMIKQLCLFHSSVFFSFDTMSPNSTSFYRKKEVDIAVDLWRFVPAKAAGNGGLCR